MKLFSGDVIMYDVHAGGEPEELFGSWKYSGQSSDIEHMLLFVVTAKRSSWWPDRHEVIVIDVDTKRIRHLILHNRFIMRFFL